MAVASLAVTPTAAQAHHGGVADEWHCVWANNADDLCIKMNQFLGWWTGFDVEYRYRGWTWYPVTVTMSWRTERDGYVRQSGAWPGRYLSGPSVNYREGTWADLPNGTCAIGTAHVTGNYPGGTYSTYEVRVCR